nr:hypothetical protein [Tanacetum cinerariifolium]
MAAGRRGRGGEAAGGRGGGEGGRAGVRGAATGGAGCAAGSGADGGAGVASGADGGWRRRVRGGCCQQGRGVVGARATFGPKVGRPKTD